MNLDEFREQFDRLTHAFTVTKPDKKAGIYFEEVCHIEPIRFKGIVTHIIRKWAKFPTIADILGEYSASAKAKLRENQSCHTCDGFGWVKIGYKVFRGDCIHGEQLSKEIAIGRKDREIIEAMNQKNELTALYGEDAGLRLYDYHAKRFSKK